MSAAELKEYLRSSVESRDNLEIMREILISLLQETSPEGVKTFFTEAKDLLVAPTTAKNSGPQKPLVIEVLRGILLTPQTSEEMLDIFSKHKVYSSILNSIVPGKSEVEFSAKDQSSSQEYTQLAKSLVYDLAQFFPGNNGDSAFAKYFDSCVKKGVSFGQTQSPTPKPQLPNQIAPSNPVAQNSNAEANALAKKMTEVLQQLAEIKQQVVLFGQQHQVLTPEGYEYVGLVVQEMLNLTEFLSDENLQKALHGGLTPNEQEELQNEVYKYRAITESLANGFDDMDPNEPEDFQAFRDLIIQISQHNHQGGEPAYSDNDSLDANRSRNRSSKMTPPPAKPQTPKEGSKSGSQYQVPSLPKLPLSEVIPHQPAHKPPAGSAYDPGRQPSANSHSSLRDPDLQRLIDQAHQQGMKADQPASNFMAEQPRIGTPSIQGGSKLKPESHLDLDAEMVKLNNLINIKESGAAAVSHSHHPQEPKPLKESQRKIAHIANLVDPFEELREFDAPKERSERTEVLHSVRPHGAHHSLSHIQPQHPQRADHTKHEGPGRSGFNPAPEGKDYFGDSNWVAPQELSVHADPQAFGRSLDKDRLGFLENFDAAPLPHASKPTVMASQPVKTAVLSDVLPAIRASDGNLSGSQHSLGRPGTQHSAQKSQLDSQGDRSKGHSIIPKSQPVGAKISFLRQATPPQAVEPTPISTSLKKPGQAEDFGKFYEQQVSQRVKPIIEENPEDIEESARGVSQARPPSEVTAGSLAIKVRDPTRVERFPLPAHLQPEPETWREEVTRPGLFGRPSHKPTPPVAAPQLVSSVVSVNEMESRPPRLRTDLKTPPKPEQQAIPDHGPKEPQVLSRSVLEREKDLLKKSFDNKYSLLQAQVQKLTTLLEDRQKIPPASSIQPSQASVPAPAHIIPNPSPTQGTILPIPAAPVHTSQEDRETQSKLVREVGYLRMLVDQGRANQSLSRDYHNLSSQGGQDLSRTLAQTSPTQNDLIDKMIRFAAGETGVVMNKHYEDEGTLFENSEMKVDIKLEKNLVLREGTFFLKGKLTLLNKTTEFLKNMLLQVKDHGQSYKMMVKPSFSEVLVEPLASVTYSFLVCPRSPQVKVHHPPVLACSYTPPPGSPTAVSPIRPLSLSQLPLGLHRYFLPDHQQSYDSHATVLATTKWEVFESEPLEVTNIEMRTAENISRLFGNLVWVEAPKNLTSPYSHIVACSGTYRFQGLRLIITIKLVRPSQVRLAVTYPKEFPSSLVLSGQVPLAGVSPLDLAKELSAHLSTVFTTSGH